MVLFLTQTIQLKLIFNRINMKHTMTAKLHYERPSITIVELQPHTMLLEGSPNGVEANRRGYGTAEEENWE